jgi:aconitase A
MQMASPVREGRKTKMEQIEAQVREESAKRRYFMEQLSRAHEEEHLRTTMRILQEEYLSRLDEENWELLPLTRTATEEQAPYDVKHRRNRVVSLKTQRFPGRGRPEPVGYALE